MRAGKRNAHVSTATGSTELSFEELRELLAVGDVCLRVDVTQGDLSRVRRVKGISLMPPYDTSMAADPSCIRGSSGPSSIIAIKSFGRDSI